MEMVNIKINDKDYSVPASYTILDAARDANVHIPTLCYLKDINQIGACRMCLVEIKEHVRSKRHVFTPFRKDWKYTQTHPR